MRAFIFAWLLDISPEKKKPVEVFIFSDAVIKLKYVLQTM